MNDKIGLSEVCCSTERERGREGGGGGGERWGGGEETDRQSEREGGQLNCVVECTESITFLQGITLAFILVLDCYSIIIIFTKMALWDNEMNLLI